MNHTDETEDSSYSTRSDDALYLIFMPEAPYLGDVLMPNRRLTFRTSTPDEHEAHVIAKDIHGVLVELPILADYREPTDPAPAHALAPVMPLPVRLPGSHATVVQGTAAVPTAAQYPLQGRVRTSTAGWDHHREDDPGTETIPAVKTAGWFQPPATEPPLPVLPTADQVRTLTAAGAVALFRRINVR